MSKCKIFMFCALKRSGHHAIINWMCKNVKNVYFLNNINGLKTKLPSKEELDLIVTNKDWFFFNVEDWDIGTCDLKLVENLNAEKIYVFRNPFNLMASRINNSLISGSLEHLSDCVGILELWKKYAKLYVSKKYTKIIFYDLWFSSEEYRKFIAEYMGFKYSELGLFDVPHYGGGSSFNSTNFDGIANKMQVLKRYHYFENNLDYISMFDEEVIKYAIEIDNKNVPKKFLLSMV